MTSERKVRVREIELDELSTQARDRLVKSLESKADPRPLLVDTTLPSGVSDVAIAAIGLATVVVTAGRGFGDGVQGRAALGLYALGTLIFANGLLTTLQRRRALARLPFTPGRYLFAQAFVDARSSRVAIASLDGDVRLEKKGETLEIVIGERREAFASKKKEIERALEAIDKAKSDEENDDPFFDLEAAPPNERTAIAPMPRWLEAGPRMVIAFAFAAIVSIALFEARNRASDEAAFDRARRDGSMAALERYVATNGKHAPEARDAIAALGVAEAAAAKGALRAKADAALAAYRAKAADDPRLMPVIERFIAAIERRNDARVPLNFRPPTRAVLDAVDTMLVARAGAGLPIVKVAPYFDGTKTKKYEPIAARAIASVFAEAFPTDVVHIEQGEPVEGAPSIEVGYIVGWSGDAVIDEAGGRRFVSVVVDFDVTIHVPEEAAYQLKYRIWPPEDLEVKVDADAKTASEGEVYAAMASHAFSSVGGPLREGLLKKP